MNNNPYFNYYNYPNFPNMNFRSVPNSFVGRGITRGPGLSGILNGTRSSGLLSNLFPSSSVGAGAAATGAKTFSFTNLLNGASKTLGVINQAIPVVYQVKPIINNAKTMFRVAKAMNSNSNSSSNSTTIKSNSNNSKIDNSNNSNNNDNGPTFFA